MSRHRDGELPHHDRMPAVLEKVDIRARLNGEAGIALLGAGPDGRLCI